MRLRLLFDVQIFLGSGIRTSYDQSYFIKMFYIFCSCCEFSRRTFFRHGEVWGWLLNRCSHVSPLECLHLENSCRDLVIFFFLFLYRRDPRRKLRTDRDGKVERWRASGAWRGDGVFCESMALAFIIHTDANKSADVYYLHATHLTGTCKHKFNAFHTGKTEWRRISINF